MEQEGALALFDKSTTLSVNDVANTETIAVYPNPASNILHTSYNGAATATVYSLTGQTLLQQNTVNGAIDISTLPTGTYMLRLYTDSGSDIRRTFVKR